MTSTRATEARRASGIAHGAYGRHRAENAERHQPTRLELRCPGSAGRDPRPAR
ncbi:hypothetical protein ACFYZB_18165 [Streptomyces sp. NPDC001852]|uniref:hypothetical protein n=1 Tax=Streptomyces sp. NPDC001852 TaxID=3364619 RepID=UPI0036796AF9